MEHFDYSDRYLRLLAQKFRTVQEVSTELINLEAILALPKGTEHFMSDIHGEDEAFAHILNNCSGVIRDKIEAVYGDTLTAGERAELATLIYYPKHKLEYIKAHMTGDLEDWYRVTLRRLAEICRVVASKYTRSKVRKALPADFAYIIDELLNTDSGVKNKENYYNRIITSIIEINRADAFITAIAAVIKRLAVDRLHIIGDVFDRGPRPDHIMDMLMRHHSVDIQWGNHDMLWMGAACGSELSALFDIAGGANDITFTAKTAGEGGVKVTNITSTDAQKDAVGKLAFKDGTDAYEKVTGGANGIKAGDKVTVNGTVYEFVANAGDKVTTEGAVAVLVGADVDASIANLNKALESEGVTVEKATNDLLFKPMSNGKGLTLQIGATGDAYNKVTINVGNMSSKGLGIDNLRNIGIMSQDAASAALDQIKNGADSAINTVSSVRAELGAMQNRLEHTINNLDVASENMQSANSQIRDTDMAKEMMEYTKKNVLTQAAQAMLAQANQQPQSILQLLQ